jgi:predicted GIY-YIG superfamily endonuclease
MINEFISKEFLLSEYRSKVKIFQGNKFLRRGLNCEGGWYCEGGLYFMYSKYSELLYIGYSNNLGARINSHSTSSSNTSHFINDVYYIKIMYSTEFDWFRSIYKDCIDIEHYLINKLNPTQNKLRPKL